MSPTIKQIVKTIEYGVEELEEETRDEVMNYVNLLASRLTEAEAKIETFQSILKEY